MLEVHVILSEEAVQLKDIFNNSCQDVRTLLHITQRVHITDTTVTYRNAHGS